MSPTTYVTDAATLGTGLLVARLILGALMVAHGGQKLFGWFGGPGIDNTTDKDSIAGYLIANCLT